MSYKEEISKDLFEVVPGIYQVKISDISYITFIQGDTGWICVDPITTTELGHTAKTLLDNYFGVKEVFYLLFTCAQPNSDNELSQHFCLRSSGLETIKIDGITFKFISCAKRDCLIDVMFFVPEFNYLYSTQDLDTSYDECFNGFIALPLKDVKKWSNSIDSLIQFFGDDINTICMLHKKPILGNISCIKYLKQQRDTYKFIYSQFIALTLKDVTIEKIRSRLKLPIELVSCWQDELHNSKFLKQISLLIQTEHLEAESLPFFLEYMAIKLDVTLSQNVSLIIGLYLTDFEKKYELEINNNAFTFRENEGILDDCSTLFLDSATLLKIIFSVPNCNLSGIKCKVLGNTLDIKQFFSLFTQI